MKKTIYILFGMLLGLCHTSIAQQTFNSLICPEAISFPVYTGCAINSLQESNCIRLGSTVYSSTHQSLATYNGTSWSLSSGNILSSTSSAITNVQFLTLGSQATDNSSGFGFSAAISDRYAVVSAPFISHGGNYGGSVFVFKKNNLGIWTQVGVIENNPTNHYSGATNWFGRSVDISGNNIIIGSHPHYNGSDEGGSIHFFTIDPLTNAISFNNTFFSQRIGADWGFGVKISGDYAIAPERAIYNSTCSATSPDLFLRIYKKNGSTWALHQTILDGKNISAASIDGDVIALAKTTGNCTIDLLVYKNIANVWTLSSTTPNIGFTPTSGSIARCGSTTNILFTSTPLGNNSIYGKHFRFDVNTNLISLTHTYNDWAAINNSVPQFPVTSLTYEGNDIIGHEISGAYADGFLRIRNNLSTFQTTATYAIPSTHNRPVAIDAEAGNIIYCSNPSRSGNVSDFKVMIGKLY